VLLVLCSRINCSTKQRYCLKIVLLESYTILFRSYINISWRVNFLHIQHTAKFFDFTTTLKSLHTLNLHTPMRFTALIAALALGSTAFAHMEMSEPAPFRSKANKNSGQNIDYSMTAPLGEGKGLCKGYQSDMGSPAGASTASYKAGGPASMTIIGGATHNGGSCQASLSYDQGKTFKVIHSFMGNCPVAGGKLDFTIPSDAKAGSAILAWTWFNKSGNREMYMNCASVTIEAGSGSAPKVAFDKRPSIFIANKPLADDCSTVEGKNLKFPDPGPDVTGSGDEGSYTGGGCGKAVSAPSGGDTPGTPANSAPSGGSSQTPATPTSGSGSSPTASSSQGAVFAAPSNAPSEPAPPSPASPASSPAAPATPATGSGGGMTGACTSEGMWNCIGGSSFQQCASGTWSVPKSMAAGMTCAAGQSSSLSMKASALPKRALRFMPRDIFPVVN
jgi:hypothetical protein